MVVTNEVFGDIKLTEEETAAYQRLMGRLNRELFSMAGEVWEVVCGIPVQLKGKKEQTGAAGIELAAGQNKEGKESLHMKFITGGAFQGKRDFAEQSWTGRAFLNMRRRTEPQIRWRLRTAGSWW